MGHHQLDELDYKILKLVASKLQGNAMYRGPLFINGYKN